MFLLFYHARPNGMADRPVLPSCHVMAGRPAIRGVIRGAMADHMGCHGGHISTHQYTSDTSWHISAHQYASVRIKTHQYTLVHIGTHQNTWPRLPYDSVRFQYAITIVFDYSKQKSRFDSIRCRAEMERFDSIRLLMISELNDSIRFGCRSIADCSRL